MSRVCVCALLHSQGDMVLLSRGNTNSRNTSPIDADTAIEGVVMDYSTRWIRVAVSALNAEGVRGPGWRLDL